MQMNPELKSNHEIWGETGSEDFNEIKTPKSRQELTGRQQMVLGFGVTGWHLVMLFSLGCMRRHSPPAASVPWRCQPCLWQSGGCKFMLLSTLGKGNVLSA